MKGKEKFKTSIGGQALMEGIMMRGPDKIAIGVRKPDGEIELKEEELNTLGMRYKFFRLPIIRGATSLIESLMIGVNALLYSAEFYEDMEEENNEDSFLYRKFGEKAEDIEIFITVMMSVFLALGLFMIIPNLLTSLFRNIVESDLVMNLIEGLIRVSIFLVYVYWVSKLEDIRRTFEYHGAEHKCIHCYEHGDELTVENVKKYPILHRRCGTSFLFMVMIISIVVLSFFGWPNPIKRLVTRVLMFPVIAGISYEVNRWIGKSNSQLSYYLSYPGLMIQKYATVREPDDSQIEVAIEALERVIPENEGEATW